jgi:ubiquinone/menaquinone biosynthesis C-methylase UbiE
MSENKKQHICPVERAGGLDNAFRKLLQNPRKLLGRYISPGMTVLDLGCGPGFFTIEISKMLGTSGKVIAADVQEGMLEKVIKKIQGTGFESRIVLHKCESDKIGITEKVDFVLAFYMVHEVPDQDKLFRELKSILKPGGKVYIFEPKFHVTKKAFSEMIDRTTAIGFEVIEKPKVFFSRAVLLAIHA